MSHKHSLSLIIASVIAAACIFSVNTFGKDIYNIVVSPQNFVINGEAVSANALNINDYKYIKIAEFAKLLDIDVSYNEITGTVTMDKTKPFDGVRIINAENPYYTVKDGEPLYDIVLGDFVNGFTLEFVKTEKGLAVVDCTGDYRIVNISFSSDDGDQPYVKIEKYRNTSDLSGLFNELYKQLAQPSAIFSTDNDATRNNIAKILRVYINGKQVLGNLSLSSGNEGSSYKLSFDTPFLINNGDTLRIELYRK